LVCLNLCWVFSATSVHPCIWQSCADTPQTSNLPASTQNIPSERGNRYDSTRLRLVPIRCLKTTLDSRNGAVWLTAINCAALLRRNRVIAATSRTDRSLCFEQDRAVRGHVRGRQVPQARCIPARLAGDAARSETVTSTCERVASTEPSSVVTLCEYARSGVDWLRTLRLGSIWSPGT
jgi:hypothetical protein